MPTTIDGLAASLQQFFAEKFPLSGAGDPGDVLLIFDSLGTPLQPGEFLGTGTAAAQDLLSHQRAAQLADQLPAGNALADGWFLPRSGSRLSRWYERLVDASASTATTESDLSGFEKSKHEAARLLEENRLIVVSGTAAGGQGGTVVAAGTHDSYYSTTMSPLDWFLDTSTSWAGYAVSSADEPPSAPAPEAVGPRRMPDFRLRVVEGTTLAASRFVQEATVAEHAPLDLVEPPPVVIAEPPPVVVGEPPFERAAVLRSKTMPGLEGVFAMRRLNRLEPQVVTRSAISVLARADLLEPVREAAEPAVAIADVDRGSALLAVLPPSVVGRKILTDTAVAKPDTSAFVVAAGMDFQAVLDREIVIAATVPKPTTSSGFSVSFEYCLVRFDRPWWDDVFLDSAGWEVSGYQPGQISSGSAGKFDGDITLMTVGMLVIRKLSIRATWSEDDRKDLASSTSLGPFCIAGASFDSGSGELRRDGMQAVAWLCQVPPFLPPAPVL